MLDIAQLSEASIVGFRSSSVVVDVMVRAMGQNEDVA